MAVRPINAINSKKYIKGLDVSLPYDKQDKDDVIRQVCCIIDNWPTLTPPNEPLSIEQLREMDGPVWVACKPIEGGNGYWCLCRYGHITTPGRTFFEVGEIPHWVFYRRPPDGETDE